jgi:hypothetical protein
MYMVDTRPGARTPSNSCRAAIATIDYTITSQACIECHVAPTTECDGGKWRVARTHARTHSCTYANARARARAHTHTHTYTHIWWQVARD